MFEGHTNPLPGRFVEYGGEVRRSRKEASAVRARDRVGGSVSFQDFATLRHQLRHHCATAN